MKKKQNISSFQWLIMVVFLVFASSCKKDDEVTNGTMTDQDGNVYKTVTIGTQTWMAENLRTTKYNDGTSIPTGYSVDNWKTLTTGAYAVYPHGQIDGLNSDDEVLQTYGALYNWYAVNTGKLAPKGWHVPTDAEWTQLMQHIDPNADPDAGIGSSIAASKLMSNRFVPDAHPRWESRTIDPTDEYGFSALPGGCRDPYFELVGFICIWWSSTEYDATSAWFRDINWSDKGVIRNDINKSNGLSVRCVKD